MMIQRPSC